MCPPWQMVAVDIFEIPTSKYNRYLLTRLYDQVGWNCFCPKANCKLYNWGIDQSIQLLWNPWYSILWPWESTTQSQTLEAFGISKSRTTTYHPAGDGLEERFNWCLLQLLRAYVEHHSNWEQCLPLVLYTYRTAIHLSTGVSPFELMYGHSATQATSTHKNSKWCTILPNPTSSKTGTTVWLCWIEQHTS